MKKGRAQLDTEHIQPIIKWILTIYLKSYFYFGQIKTLKKKISKAYHITVILVNDS